MLPLIEGLGALGMMDILQWLIVNTVLPLLPIPLFYLAVWLSRKPISWIPPIRDGQICFYSTTMAIITIKDILSTNPTGLMWFFGLAGCWVVSLFIYGFSVYSTLYPSTTVADKKAVDSRVAAASIFCGVLTTAIVVGLRLHYGALK
jgi:hypothetical protein